MNKAIIFVDAKSDDNVETPISFLKAGGISLLERQLRQLNNFGIDHVYLFSFAMPELLHNTISRFKKSPKRIEVVDANFIDTSFWDDIEKVLLLEEGCLIDDRIIDAVYNSNQVNTIAMFDSDAVMYGKSNGIELDVAGSARVFSSCASTDAEVLKAASLDEGFKDNPLHTTLDNIKSMRDYLVVEVSQLDPYLPNHRREVPILWRPISNKKECKKATKIIIDNAQKGTLDWPAKFIHPIFENTITYYCLPTFLTPNIITVITGVLGFYIAYLFAIGQMGPALAGAMIIGVLDGVDGKLARVKMLASKIGDLEHILDKFVEYSWYLAMAYYFANVSGNSGPWAVGWLIVLFAWAETVQGEFFRRLTGKQLDDTGVFERTFRLIGARRNTQIWALIPFGLTQNWELGFWMLAVYSVITFFVAQWRFIVRTRDYTMTESETIADNINKTRYF